MRKFISSILSFIMVLSFTTPIYAYNSTGSEATDINAETPAGQDTLQGHKSEYEQYENVDGASTEVYASRESTFTVKLPKVIILDGESGTAEYTIQINGDVIDEDIISVVPNQTEIELNTAKGNRAPIKATVNQDKTAVSGADISEDWGASIEGSITAEDLKAGSWKSTLSFNISIDRASDKEPNIEPDIEPDKEPQEIEYVPFEITRNNKEIINFTDTMTNFTIPATFQGEDGTWYKVTSIGANAFHSANSLKSVVIPDTVTTIKQSAFAFCHALTSVEIPDSVTRIEVNAFFNDVSLKRVEIPAELTDIGDGAFPSGAEIIRRG